MVDNQYGCIMADEMGLGKTLQCIALLWTLVKQSPHAGKPTIEKCIIACPSSLVKNWANELGMSYPLYLSSSVDSSVLVKWLGKDAISALAIDGKGGKAELLQKVGRWVEAKGRNVTQPGLFLSLDAFATHDTLSDYNEVMIVSYETLRTLSAHLASCSIGLLLCDEGHRLKNSGLCPLLYSTRPRLKSCCFFDADSLTFQSLNALDVKRRVILTGTPIQVSV